MYSSARKRLWGNKFGTAVHVDAAVAFTKPVMLLFECTLKSASDSPRLLGHPLADYLEVID
jgi:hypothetical protein